MRGKRWRSLRLSASRIEADDLSRVHDIGGVEGALDAAHQLADAVLGRDRAAMRKHPSMHDMVHLVPAGDEGVLVGAERLGNIVMNIAVAHMAEGADAGARHRRHDSFFGLGHEMRDLRYG